MISLRRRGRRGFVLVMMGLTAFALFGITGLAVDIGRMYIAKNEAQTFADAGAMIAGLKINGMASGILSTAQLVAADSNRYNIGNSSFTQSNVVLEYSTAQSGTLGYSGQCQWGAGQYQVRARYGNRECAAVFPAGVDCSDLDYRSGCRGFEPDQYSSDSGDARNRHWTLPVCASGFRSDRRDRELRIYRG